MADYKYAGPTDTDGVVRLADGACIPNDQGNRDWREYGEYVAGGGATDPYATEQEQTEVLRGERLAEVPLEYVRRLEGSTGKEYKGSEWEDVQYRRLLNKKIDNNISPNQDWFLKVIDQYRLDAENLELYISAPERTFADLTSLDVTSDGWWTEAPK